MRRSIFLPGQRGRTAGGGGISAGIGINSAERVGLPALGAVGVEQEIVKIPEHEVVVALGRAQAFAAGGVDLEQHPAIHQQREKLGIPGKPCCRRNLLIFCGVDSEARAAAIFGSPILNNAPARGDSSTISPPRRRK